MIIDTLGVALGEYTLVLESFDQDSNGVESTLKTDTITIVIAEPTPEPIQEPATESIELPSIISEVKS